MQTKGKTLDIYFSSHNFLRTYTYFHAGGASRITSRSSIVLQVPHYKAIKTGVAEHCNERKDYQLPTLVLLAALFATLTFWGVGLDGGLSSFLYYFLMVLASFWAGSSFVTFVSGFVPSVILGYIVVVAILAYFTLFSGFYMNRERIPDYWIWLHYISLIKYSFEAVLQNEFVNQGKCFARGVEIFDNSPLVDLPNAMKSKLLESISDTLGVAIDGSTCFTTGSDVLKQLGVTELSKWNCLFVMVAWGFLFRILFYLTLLLGSKNKRS